VGQYFPERFEHGREKVSPNVWLEAHASLVKFNRNSRAF
jgi:hypothetical protein